MFQWNTIVDNCVTSGGVATLSCLPALLKNLINGLLVLAGAAAVIFVIFSGIRLITSGGDSKQVDSARQALSHALIGLILILLSFFIVNIISFITNASCINTFGFTNCAEKSNPNPTLSPGELRRMREGP